MTWVLRVQRLLADHVAAPAVVLDLHLVFRVHGILFAFYVLWAEQRVDEEMTEAVEAFCEGTVFDVEKVVGMI